MDRAAKQMKAPGVPRAGVKPKAPTITAMPGVTVDPLMIRQRPWDFKMRLGDGDINTPEARGLWFTCAKHALGTVARIKREFTTCDLWELLGGPTVLPPGIRTDEISKTMRWGQRKALLCLPTGRYDLKRCLSSGHHDVQVWTSLKFGQSFSIGGYPA
jgi:hypothetical protein